MPLPLRILIAGLCVSGVLAENTVLKPPANCAKVTLGKVSYLKGDVYLANHQDTTALKAFGFQRLEFAGRSLGNVKYSAIWPATVSVDSLAAIVSGLDYELVDVAPVAAEPEPVLLIPSPELQEMFEREAAAVDTTNLKLPYRRVVVGDLNKDGVVYYYKYKPTPKKRADENTQKEINDETRGTFHVTPIEKDPFHKKESVVEEDDPGVGLIHVTPIEGGRYHKKEDVFVPDDPNVGTYHVLPVEEGRYHKPENVGTKDHPAVGTFHTRPDPKASSLRPTDFGILRDYSNFQTGQTFFTTPGGSQSWRMIGAGGQPRTMSVQEWRRLNGR